MYKALPLCSLLLYAQPSAANADSQVGCLLGVQRYLDALKDEHCMSSLYIFQPPLFPLLSSSIMVSMWRAATVILTNTTEVLSLRVRYCYITFHKSTQEQAARVRVCNSNRSLQSGQNYWTILKIEHLVQCMCSNNDAQLCSLCYYF